MNLAKMNLAIEGQDDKYKQCFLKNCDRLGLDPEWIGMEFRDRTTGAVFTLRGLLKLPSGYTALLLDCPEDAPSTSMTVRDFLKNCETV